MSCCGTTIPDTTDNRAAEQAPPSEPGLHSISFVVPTMHCAGCIRTLENGLARISGVKSARANLSLRRVEVVCDSGKTDTDELVGAINALGFDSFPADEAGDSDRELRNQVRYLLLCLAVAGFASANIMLLSVSVWSGAEAETARLFALISGLIAVPAIFFAGSPFFLSAVKALRGGQLNMDVPISLAVLLSLFMSTYEALIGGGETFFDAGVMLLFFLLIGRTLDHLMRQKAASGVRSLARLIPQKVTRIGEDGTRKVINLSDVKTGMVLRLLPGDRFPVDGRIVRGESAADRSVVTGEAGDVPVRIGNTFEAGTLNLSSPIDIEAISQADTSFLAEVLEMMKAAEAGKGRYRRIADRMAAIYAPAVHLLALATFIGWMVVTGEFRVSLTAAIAVLIITCPCALGLAVPVAHVVAADRLFREGIMMRDGSALERLAEVTNVFFDKTGTLTSDRLHLTEKPHLSGEHVPVLSTLVKQSRHPVAQAIARDYAKTVPAVLSNVSENAGIGIEAAWNGKRVRLGRCEWVKELAGVDGNFDTATTIFAIEGATGYSFRVTSDLKTDAVETVRQLQSLGCNIALLSGDHKSNVGGIARKLGIKDWIANLTPQGKTAEIEKCGGATKVLMVGDGLNDAPSLAAAHVSMAPASATDVSRTSADFVYTRPSLLAVPFALKLSRAANRIVRQNFALALLYNCIAVPLAMTGHVTPLVAAIAMSLSSIVVVLNSMRLAGFDGGRSQHRLNKVDIVQPSISKTTNREALA